MRKVDLLSLLLVMTFMIVPAGAEDMVPQDDYQHEMQSLIEFVENSSSVFIRNGQQHTGHQAAEHMRLKYHHQKHRILTTEDFIERCASRSSLTKRPYLIQARDGQQKKLADVLYFELQKMRTQHVVAHTKPDHAS